MSADLTPQQHKFARLVASGMKATPAYREAYDVKPKVRENWVYVESCRLRQHPKVAQRIAELQGKLDDQVGPTLREHMDRLDEIGNAAAKLGDMGTAARCESNRGKAVGHYDGRGEGKITAVFAIPMKAKDSKAWEQKYLPQPPKKGK